MSTNSMPKTCLSDDEESLLFSLNGLDIKDENKPNEGSGTNVEERPWIPILIKKDHNSQIQMTNNGINFDNVPEEPPQSQQ
uniref:Uncharacterized protein n=1 Tax=Strongyloides venezuelensis TaxID=75913 RepID=A0A0K0FX52_STRVS